MDIHYPVLVPLTRKNVSLFLICLVMNVVLRYITTFFELPLWLDTIGTMCVGIILGPWTAIVLAIATTIINCVVGDISSFYYAIVQVAVGSLVGVFYPRCREFTRYYAYTIFLLVFVAVAMSCPVNMLLYQGFTGLKLVDNVFRCLYDIGCAKWLCAILTEVCIEFPDKTISLLLATSFVHFYADKVGAPDWALFKD